MFRKGLCLSLCSVGWTAVLEFLSFCWKRWEVQQQISYQLLVRRSHWRESSTTSNPSFTMDHLAKFTLSTRGVFNMRWKLRGKWDQQGDFCCHALSDSYLLLLFHNKLFRNGTRELQTRYLPYWTCWCFYYKRPFALLWAYERDAGRTGGIGVTTVLPSRFKRKRSRNGTQPLPMVIQVLFRRD